MIYLSSSAIKKDKIGDVLDWCKNNAIMNVELSGGTQYYDTILQDLKEYQRKYLFQYACHAYFPPPKKDFVVNLASCNDDIYQCSVEHYLNCIQMLRSLDCRVLGVHAGFLIEVGVEQIGKEISADIIYDKGQSIERFCTAYSKIVKEASKYAIDVYIENNVLDSGNYNRFDRHNYFMMTDYASIMEMKRELEFPLLLDLGHLFVSSKTLDLDFVQQVQNLKSHVKWLHVSDNNGIFDQHKPLCKGSPVYDAFETFIDNVENVTLEAKGSLEEIKENYEWICKLMQSQKTIKERI